MPRNSSFLPTPLQQLCAVTIGVGIGLVLSHFYYKHTVPTPQNLASEVTQAGSAFSSAIAHVKVVPTLESRMNILLMGVDSNGTGTARFTNCRSDSMIVVSCDPVANRVGVVSIPRDSRVAIPGHGTDKINAAHALGGPELSVETVKDDFQIPIDHYIVIDTQGLRKVFQALGPVKVVVEKKMRYTDHAGHLHVALDPGEHILTPEQAEEYVRFRHDARGDLGRIERQQWFLRQVSQKLREPQVVLKLPELFKLAHDYVVTDLSVQDMARLAAFGKDIKPQQVETATLPGQVTCIRGGSYVLPDYAADAVVFNRLMGTPITVAQDQDDQSASPNSAIAADDDDGGKPISFLIKYPKGCEKTASAFEKGLIAAGYAVKSRLRIDAGDCAHEQLIQSSYRADDVVTQRVCHRFPMLSNCPVNVTLDAKAPTDFVLIINADTVAPVVPHEKAKEAASKQR